MSDKIQPATDEFIDRIRMKPTPVEERLIARIDAERARAEKAEAQNARMRAVLTVARDDDDDDLEPLV